MSSICNLRAKYVKLFSTYDKVSDECPDNENYSTNVLDIVLQILGYTTGENKDSGTSIVFYNGSDSRESKDNYNEANKTAKDANTLGYIVNINEAHWICYKKSKLNSTDDSFYRINSMSETDEIAVSIKTQTIGQLINQDYDVSGGARNQYLSLHPITILKPPTTNQTLYNLFTSSSDKDRPYKNLLDSAMLDYKWKLFIKNVILKIIGDNSYDKDITKLKIMLYLSNLTSDIIDEPLKQQILASSKEIESKIVDIFVENTKKNINSINITELTTPQTYIERSKGIFTPTTFAKDRFYYNLNNTNTYDKRQITNILTSINYKSVLMPGLKAEIISAISSATHASSGGGGSKPTHNTNASKSRHNSSFKASSSKAKAKSRSHTQRVK